MPCDYDAIRQDNKRRYGTEIAEYGPMLLADRYDDRTHFIYELLQNAEDALARRARWRGSRAVTFDLNGQMLRVSHYGAPFDGDDVAGVCGIAKSTKDLTAIGRFGIGFKSVYAFSDRPEIHSGDEDFAVESYVWPVAAAPVERDTDETVILIPLKADADKGVAEIAAGLSRLGATSLLFLREIEEIRWTVDGVPAGHYLRQSVDRGAGVRSVTVVGQKGGDPDVDEEWLVCSREVYGGKDSVGHVEVAWSLAEHEDGRPAIRPVEQSRLVVYFPTAVETGLGFLIQGPYRTTPSRDNVPSRNDWNRECVSETGTVLVESLRWLREHGLLDADALACLPLDRGKFERSMFGELFEVTKEAFSREDLLPAHGGGHVSASEGRMARTQELRNLLDPAQLGKLEGVDTPLRWVDGQVSQDRSPILRQYLTRVLGMTELTPDALLPRLKKEFLESQGDGWTQGLYEFLGSQAALRSRLASLPIVRLSDGAHVVPAVGGEKRAFLPGPTETAFPTVRQAVCGSDDALSFLKSLGLTEPDPVDNVALNILPKYRDPGADVSETDYAADVERLLAAAQTDSASQGDKLVKALRATPWVRAVDAGDGRRLRAKPDDVYVSTERLRELFAGVKGVLLVDRGVPILRGEAVRELLERSGADRYLQPVAVPCALSPAKLSEIRRQEGLERRTWGAPNDVTIRGMEALLERLPMLEPDERSRRAAGLWEALRDLHERRGPGTFNATYRWGFNKDEKTATFDPQFVRLLNESQWVPHPSGGLREPESVTLDKLGWPSNGFLESKIRFKPPLVERLAEEVGIEPGVLDLLKQLGVTSEAALRERLELDDNPPSASADGPEQTVSGAETATNAGEGRGPAADDDGPTGGGEGGAAEGGASVTSTGEGAPTGSGASGSLATEGEGTNAGEEGSAGTRFVSYVGVVREGAEGDSDGLEHARRMELETEAIKLILSQEPDWQRTPPNNAGFDLYRGSRMGLATEWCEVKAMTGTLQDRPVGLSRTQFEFAQECGDAYWLYVVERAGTDEANIVRIQDPAGKAMTFTFDHGWRAVATDQLAEDDSA